MPAFQLQPTLDALKKVLRPSGKPISLHEPCFRGNEWKYVKECIDTGWVSSVGKFVDRFEADLVTFTGAKHAIATMNGTAALHICLLLLDTRENDEVLVPALTFAATANAVMYCRAVPHFIDSNESTLGVDPQKLDLYLKAISESRSDGTYNKKTGRRIHAIIPMHTFGHSVDLDPLLEVCARYKIQVIEDAAESLGSTYKGRHTGTFGRVACLSFNGNKVVTTGGGGAILTQEENLAKRAKHLTTTAKTPHAWEFFHDPVGYNYRLPNLNAAMGCAQLEELPEFLKQKRVLAERYAAAFQGISGIRFFIEPPYGSSNYWLNALLLDESAANSRNALLEATHAVGLLTRPVWTLLNKLPAFQECPRMDLSQAESIERRLINIPSSAVLGAANV